MVAAEKEQLVLPDWSADSSTVLVPLERAFRRRKILARVKQIVTQELKQIAVEIVRTGLRHGSNGRRAPPVGGEAARLDFEFLRRIREGQVQTHTCKEIDVIGAVQTVVRSGWNTPANGDLRAAEQPPCSRSRLHRRPRQRDQVRNVPAIQRQLQDTLIFDHLSHARRPGFHESRIGLNLNLLCYLTHLKYNIDLGAGVDLQNDSALHKRSESHQGRFQSIRANGQIRQDVATGLVCQRRPGNASFSLRCRDID